MGGTLGIVLHDQVGALGAATAAAGASQHPIAPVVILVLCVFAGIGTVLLLPSRREDAIRKIGGSILLATALVFAAVIVRYVATLKQGGMSLYFWIFSAVALVGAVRVVTHPRPVYSALYFVLTVLASAGLFVLLWAEFMAIALIVVYAGAILVTYVFVIMLATQSAQPPVGARQLLAEYDTVSREPLAASAIGFGMMGLLLFVIFDKTPASALTVVASATRPTIATQPVLTTQPAMAAVAEPGSAQAIGQYLFTHQIVNLELAGLILTVGMIGAILIARRRVLVEAPVGAAEAGAAEAGELHPIDEDPHAIPIGGTLNPRAKQYPES